LKGPLQKLLERLEPFDSVVEGRKYSELDPDGVKAFGASAVLIELKGDEHWLPYSQLRDDNGQLMASDWILEQKGIEV
jgi:hypothetical protein